MNSTAWRNNYAVFRNRRQGLLHIPSRQLTLTHFCDKLRCETQRHNGCEPSAGLELRNRTIYKQEQRKTANNSGLVCCSFAFGAAGILGFLRRSGLRPLIIRRKNTKKQLAARFFTKNYLHATAAESTPPPDPRRCSEHAERGFASGRREGAVERGQILLGQDDVEGAPVFAHMLGP